MIIVSQAFREVGQFRGYWAWSLRHSIWSEGVRRSPASSIACSMVGSWDVVDDDVQVTAL